MDNIRKGYHPRQEACRDKDGKVLFDKEVMNRWAEHFREALNKECPSCNNQGKLDLTLKNEESDKGENSETPTYEETEESIKKLKNGRVPGEDNIIPEMIKYGKNQLVKKMTRTNMCHMEGRKDAWRLENCYYLPIFFFIDNWVIYNQLH